MDERTVPVESAADALRVMAAFARLFGRRDVPNAKFYAAAAAVGTLDAEQLERWADELDDKYPDYKGADL